MIPNDEILIAEARRVREHAYAPYSHFRVGAVVCLEDGRTFSGVNVENASYGLTVCAERNAIAAAVGAGAGPGDLAAVAIAGEGDEPISPCGACRQVLRELGAEETRVLMTGGTPGAPVLHRTLAELLPLAFERGALDRR